MKNYELNCLILPHISQEELHGLNTRIENYIKEGGGNTINVKNALKRSLPGKIKTRQEGKTDLAYFSVFNFMILAEEIQNLEKKLLTENQIIRYFILNKKDLRSQKHFSRTGERKQAIKKQEKVTIEKLDEKLEEILGNV